MWDACSTSAWLCWLPIPECICYNGWQVITWDACSTSAWLRWLSTWVYLLWPTCFPLDKPWILPLILCDWSTPMVPLAGVYEYVRVYECILACMCVWVRAYVSVYALVCVHRMCIHVHACAHAYKNGCVCVQVFMFCVCITGQSAKW